MTTAQATIDLLHHLAGRPGHDEVKADFQQLLVAEFGLDRGALEFERRVPEIRGRLDALIGRTVFEAKSDLDREWPDLERRLPDYLADREREEGERFVGIASDGRAWAVFELDGGALVMVKRTQLDPERAEGFLAWLDGALALKSSLAPDPLTIRAELGRDSIAFHRVDVQLRAQWQRAQSDPAVALKRQLWAELLKQVYGREVESDALWFQHTFLVVVAKCIALAVLRLHEDEPQRLLSGDAFAAVGINGAVESDFFDWVVESPAGEALVRRIINHVRRFRLSEVACDVLKVLYESLIDRDERHGLGEYYTPDWLAAKVVRHAVDRPLEQRVLDPACGSGTFLFHAIRLFLREAEEAGMEPERRAAEVAAHVAGTDIHPVAVIIARATYLLALAPALAHRSGALSIPVYQGDAMRPAGSRSMAGPAQSALFATAGQVDILVGNPPWVAFRHMSREFRKRFSERAKAEGVYVGGRFATQNDLSALFTVRAAQLRLRSGGRLGFVLPLAALSRGQFEKLRSGSFQSVSIAWDAVWTMDDSVQPLFPVPSCVVFGRRRAVPQALPDQVRAYSGSLPLRDAPEDLADALLAVTEGAPALQVGVFAGGSPYRKAFRQGATLVPRMLCLVQRPPAGRLGGDPSAPFVVSRRTSQEKPPWKSLPGLDNRIEAEFLRPVLLGESILPYRVFQRFEGVIPATEKGEVLDAEAMANRGYGGIFSWMGRAEAVWTTRSEGAEMTLIGRWNYHNELTAQFPIASLRVVYAKAGTLPAACLLRDPRGVVDHMLYWMAPESEAEGRYLTALLNSETARAGAEQFQARGQFGARHFDKVVFNLPIPRFDARDPCHRGLAAAAEQAEKIAAAVELPEGVKFQRARGLVRTALAAAGVAQTIDRLVARLLDSA